MKRSQAAVVGFALFAMFFGAGNMIFPPYLGMQAGSAWLPGFLCFLTADVGLAFLTVAALLRRDGSMTDLARPLGRVPAALVCGAVVVCLGPLFCVPRTAATTYELLVRPFADFSWGMPVFSLLYLAVTVLLAIRPARVVDIVGKVLTPLLFAGLLVLVAAGVFRPLGSPAAPRLDSVAREGLVAGYQTMDTFGALVFSAVVLSAVGGKGAPGRRRNTFLACGLAGACLFLVYCGLAYLGATVSGEYGTELTQSALLLNITERLLGRGGVLLLGIVVALACLTTAIGLTSSCAYYFAERTKGRLSYRAGVLLLAGVSFAVANLGLQKIISFAAPVLTLLYPVVLVLILLSFFDRRLTNVSVHRGAALCALAVSVCELLAPVCPPLAAVSRLPLAGLGLGWVVPAVLGGCAGALVRPRAARALHSHASAD